MRYDVMILGSGPAGLGAAIYAKRAMLSYQVVEKQPMGGGQIANTGEVDNYLGLYGIGGFSLAQKFREHAEQLEVPFCRAEVTGVEPVPDGFLVHVRDGEAMEARTVIVATGAKHRLLGIPGEKEWTGAGVSYCATCDGAFFRGKDVAVIGGGDVALSDALYLARLARRVYLIHRRAELRGAKHLQERVLANERITFVPDTVVTAIVGDGKVSAVQLTDKNTEASRTLPVDGVFIAVGMEPETGFLGDLVQKDGVGYVLAGEEGVTSVPGLFAIGDVRTKRLRQVITAVSDGANAIASVEAYLAQKK